MHALTILKRNHSFYGLSNCNKSTAIDVLKAFPSVGFHPTKFAQFFGSLALDNSRKVDIL